MKIIKLDNSDITRLGEIDRSENIKLCYKFVNGELIEEKVDIKATRWDQEKVQKMIDLFSPDLEMGGTLFGAFEGEELAGMAMLGGRFRGEDKDTIQLSILHVSRDFRRRGVARDLMDRCCDLARERGAKKLYVSATPTGSAVGFYLSRGCKLAEKVDKELFAIEPEDIHLILDL